MYNAWHMMRSKQILVLFSLLVKHNTALCDQEKLSFIVSISGSNTAHEEKVECMTNFILAAQPFSVNMLRWFKEESEMVPRSSRSFGLHSSCAPATVLSGYGHRDCSSESFPGTGPAEGNAGLGLSLPER